MNQPEHKPRVPPEAAEALPSDLHADPRIYFAEPSMAARRVLWHVYAVFYRSHYEPTYAVPSQKPGAYLSWLRSGEVELQLPGHTLKMTAGNQVFLVDMKQQQTYVPLGKKPARGMGIRFSGPALDAWLELLIGGQSPMIELRDMRFLHSAHRELCRLIRRRPPAWEWHVHVALNNVVGQLLATRKVLATSREELPRAMARVLDAIAAEPLRDWRATELAAAAGVSYSRLRELFHLAGQGTIHQHIQKLRLDRARLLLSDQRLSIKDIANQMHFSSEFYFSHFFKNLTGMSPRQFRESLHGVGQNRK